MISEWAQKCQSLRREGGETLADILNAALELKPDSVAIHYEDRAISFRELDSAANRIANGLIALGVKPGERVSIHVDNRPEFIFIYLGVMRAGAVLVPTNVMYTGEEIEHILTDSGAKVLFIVSAMAEKMNAVAAPELETIIEVGGSTLENASDLEAFMSKSDTRRPDVSYDPDKVAIIQYTSGTTGKPKGAMVSHNNVFAVLDGTLDLPSGIESEESDSTLLVLPLFHAYALDLCINRAFMSAQPLILINRFDAEKVFQNIEKHKVTIFYGAPPMFFAFVNTPGMDKHDVSCLRAAFSGAAPLPVVIMEGFEKLTGVVIKEGYGLSETAPTLSTNAAGPVNKPGAVGPPIPGVKLRIVDDDDNDVSEGDVGEIIAQGPNIFLGYWNQPEATAEAKKGGWFHTGDMGRFDEDGYLYIVDRKKDMLVVSGYNVYPIELENVILRHEKIADCAVIGVPHEYQGESVKAVVVMKPDESMSEAEVQGYCREHMAAFKVPRFVVFRDELPKNPTGKVLKRVIREQEGGVTKARI